MKQPKSFCCKKKPNKRCIFLSLLASAVFLTTEAAASASIESSSPSRSEITVSSHASRMPGQFHDCHSSKGMLSGCDAFYIHSVAYSNPHSTLTITNNSSITANSVTADLSIFPTINGVTQDPAGGCTVPANGTCTLRYFYVNVGSLTGPFSLTVQGSNTNPVVVTSYLVFP